MAFQASGFSINIWAVSACIWCYCSFMPSSATRFPLTPTAIATSLVLPMAYGLFNSECCTYVILCVRFLTDINANEFRVQMKFISSNWYLIQWWLFTLPLLLINFIPIKWWKIKTTSPRLTPTDSFSFCFNLLLVFSVNVVCSALFFSDQYSWHEESA